MIQVLIAARGYVYYGHLAVFLLVVTVSVELTNLDFNFFFFFFVREGRDKLIFF